MLFGGKKVDNYPPTRNKRLPPKKKECKQSTTSR